MYKIKNKSTRNPQKKENTRKLVFVRLKKNRDPPCPRTRGFKYHMYPDGSSAAIES